MTKSVLVLSGPNLNMLGTREPGIYGDASLDDIMANMRASAEKAGMTLTHVQSNTEGDLVTAIQQAVHVHDAIVINPGALTHYAWSLHDALRMFAGPIIEVHLSNTAAREEWRHTSVVAPVATGTIMGLGPTAYQLAIQALEEIWGAQS